MRRNFAFDERAWLKVDYEFPPFTANAAVKVQIRNAGKSVAFHADAHTMFEIVQSDKAPSFNPVALGYQTILPLLFPADAQSFQVTRTPNNPDGSSRPLTTMEVENPVNGKAYIAIFGIVTYSDQFGSHWTRYCTWTSVRGPVVLNAGFNAAPCVSWNGVGDGTPPM